MLCCTHTLSLSVLRFKRRSDPQVHLIFIKRFPSFLGEFFKSRCNGGSGGGELIGATSPTSTYHHPNPPLSQLREMLTTTSVSDVEHNSDDHHDVKDLSFRGSSNEAAQASIVGSSTSNGANGLMHHMDTSDYDSTRSPTTSSGTTSTTSTRMTTANINLHLNNLSPPHAHENNSVRIRKLSENSTDVEHCNNNYKFKNYIQQRFTHETYHSEESMQSNQCATEHHDKEHHHVNETNNNNIKKSSDGATKLNGIHQDIKNEVMVSNSPSPAQQQSQQQQAQPSAHLSTRANGKLTNGTVNGNSQNMMSHHSIPIPIFACHTQGFYVPLNLPEEVLIPFLSGMDLLNKNFTHLPPLHPISINVNYTPALIKNAIATAPNHFIKPKVENGIINGW